MSAVRRLLERAQPGSAGGIEQHIRRGERLVALIAERWGIERPEQWRAKHVRWALERGLAELSPASRYHYYRSARVMAAALGRWPAWQVSLRGPWTRPSGSQAPTTQAAAARGGCPPKLSHRVRLLR